MHAFGVAREVSRCLTGVDDRVRTGMRRPSWNKSQAIQQVISLKALLETTSSDSNANAQAEAEAEAPQNPTTHVRLFSLKTLI